MLQRGFQSSAGRICVVTAGGHHPAIIINSLTDAFGPIDVIREKPEGRSLFLKRRAKKVGYAKIAGQLVTMLLIVAMKRIQAGKIKRRLREQGLLWNCKAERPCFRSIPLTPISLSSRSSAFARP